MTKNIQYFSSAIVLSFFVFWGTNIFQNNFNNYLTANILGPAADTFLMADDEKAKSAPEINAQAAISVKIYPNGQEKILLQKNIEKPLPIASLTKLMSALVVLQNPVDFDFSKIITISRSAASQGDTPKYGNLTTGEKYTLEKLFEIMMVYSSNDSSWALSELIGTDNFIEKMNQIARNLNMNYTYFLNPTGLDPKNSTDLLPQDLNHSTAQDLVELSRYLLQNYPQIFQTTLDGYQLPIENGLSAIKLREGQNAIGGKTGYTKNAKGNLLFVFQDKDGNKYINVVLGAQTEESRIQEMQKIIDWLSF